MINTEVKEKILTDSDKEPETSVEVDPLDELALENHTCLKIKGVMNAIENIKKERLI